MKDDLGDRMKENYENRYRFYLPRRTNTIIRLDGKSFHSYTKHLEKPFDKGLVEDLDKAVINVLPHIQGVQFAYIQSDEISLLLQDFATPNTDCWFDGNLQKMVSVSASILTAEFNSLRAKRFFSELKANLLLSARMDSETEEFGNTEQFKLAYFDSRIFAIPDRTEVMNYFICRNNDSYKNAISMLAQSKFSHKQLQNKNGREMIEMLSNIGVDWKDYPQDVKNGRLIVKEHYFTGRCPDTERSRWVVKPAWKFSEAKETLLNMIPTYS